MATLQVIAAHTPPPSPPASMHGGGEVSFLRCSEEETEILREKNRRAKVLRVLPSGRTVPHIQGFFNFLETRLARKAD